MPFDSVNYSKPQLPTTRVSKIIRDGVTRLQTRGWCKDMLEDHAGHRCAIGSLVERLGDLNNEKFHEAIEAMSEAAIRADRASVPKDTCGFPPAPIVYYNNKIARTVDDVIGVMLDAAQRVEEDAYQTQTA